VRSNREVLFFDGRSHYEFIDKLFLQLGKYYDEFISNTKEAPYSYSERTFVGHLAQSACRNGYYSIQDYDIAGKNVKRHLKPYYRPDLRIWVTANKVSIKTCVFEAKITDPFPFDKDTKALSRIILDKLKGAEDQMNNQGYIEGLYQCAIVASPLSCTWPKYLSYKSNPNAYRVKVNELRENIISFLNKSYVNFIWFYITDYENIKELRWKEEGKIRLPPVGLICTGQIRRYHSP
jgi:hypothetical protein